MNAVVAFPSPAEQTLAEQFRSLDVMEAGRRDDFAAFAIAGLPHRRMEAWHYTDLRSLLREALPLAAVPDAATVERAKAVLAELPPVAGGRIVLLDGHLVDGLCAVAALPDGVTIRRADATAGSVSGDLAAALDLGREDAIVRLNGAMAQDMVTVVVAAGAEIEAPLELVSLTSGRNAASHYTRTLVEIGAEASVTIIERHAALVPAGSQGHHLLAFAVGEVATLQHVCRIDDLGAEALHIGTSLVRLAAKADFNSTTLIVGRGVTRRQAMLEFAGPHACGHFNGASLLDGRSHADTTLVVTHKAPHCESRELYKHVLGGEATGVYQGKVVVAPGAQKTDGKMLSKAVFLDDGASMFNKPELEIFADDVVCGHGATAGALDEGQLFYLRARGIPRQEAEAMLLEAFVEEAFEEVALVPLREELAGRTAAWLRARKG